MSVDFGKETSCSAGVLTVSDTRTVESDKSGAHIQALLEENGHQTMRYAIVPDEQEAVGGMIGKWLEDDQIDLIIVTGGTGIAPRDITIETVKPLLQKEIPGFGEFFRYLSFTEDIGTKAMLSRALAGTAKGGKLLFALPGSRGAVDLAMRKLILPEAAHLLHEARK
ncbi:MogA/MoaB family molybdenum cofactor biosynthesis protein [Domibacillus sp. PGB-M46]|uniref:MogA/MoaB family molybdenum cofactor biosynthesis protein n=1 Tax=Domibacillus sp. PGB-M46 TaxID=2910255 RepID=UPI001F5968C0|nr:MogA/MoaB family molybdenum cofactor biosynthesis protein [Domibacillus sp. PGB-M46]MCI2255649.1 MogA/MoaB family molybdenum cofactor biosynthesis protein [Domibacillus sp. PGB-M46]